ncbi:alpha-hydroxy acid oxidase [Nocardioides limicola]|uniref:alpha-hydroxy acid oxidase n=1 Tax=Nocardioides limicola TaxID=2803368 RepID=UPI00193BC651|nr:alpha-hydroxy acid oxidase [Nocardioides sp. DJM-14]
MVHWLAEIEDRARQALSAPVYRYVVQGSGAGVSAAEATQSWARTRFVPRVLREVDSIELATDLLGTEFATPIGVAPTTLQRAVHSEGERGMAAAAAAVGAPLVVSSNAGTEFADIVDPDTPWWVQAYLSADRGLALPMLERAVDAGARAVVLTVDTPVVASKDPGDGPVIWDVVDPGLLRVNFQPGYDDQVGAEKATDLGPHDIVWLADKTGLPVVVKGVLHPEDARRCVQAGASAVWVSNHGGRQLDRAASVAACLPGVAAEVGDSAQVYADGGVRSGLDVLSALAAGADAVFCGRVPLLALAAGGGAGVQAALTALTDELVEALRLAGCRTPVDARGLLWRAQNPLV